MRDAGASTGPTSLDRWADDARSIEAAQRRARHASLVNQAAETATLAGLLVDMGERAAAISVHLTNGVTHHGTIIDVGSDYFRIDTAAGPAIVSSDATASIRPRPGTPSIFSARPGSTTTLDDLLADLAADECEVSMTTRTDPGPLLGRLLFASLELLGLVVGEDQRVFVTRSQLADVRLTERPRAW